MVRIQSDRFKILNLRNKMINHLIKLFLFLSLIISQEAFSQTTKFSRLQSRSASIVKEERDEKDTTLIRLELALGLPSNDSLTGVEIQFTNNEGKVLHAVSGNLKQAKAKKSVELLNGTSYEVDNSGDTRITVLVPYDYYVQSSNRLIVLKDKAGLKSKGSYIRFK